LFGGEYDELRAVPVNGFGGRFDGCVGEYLSRVAAREEHRGGATMDFAVPRFGELVDSFSGSCTLEKPFSKDAFDDSWEGTPREKHRQSDTPRAYAA
jgi:hypothetical protein